jgi:hypothetical protein
MHQTRTVHILALCPTHDAKNIPTCLVFRRGVTGVEVAQTRRPQNGVNATSTNVECNDQSRGSAENSLRIDSRSKAT